MSYYVKKEIERIMKKIDDIDFYHYSLDCYLTDDKIYKR
jgi:hypothetical protein